jgi:hypothetical protein
MPHLDRAEIYRRRAAEIAALAEGQNDPNKREFMLRTAEEWLKLAVMAEQTLGAQASASMK